MDKLRTRSLEVRFSNLVDRRAASGENHKAHSLGEMLYLNCDLQDVARALEKPESFFPTVQKPVVVLDEVHQLVDPSRVLKMAPTSFRTSRS